MIRSPETHAAFQERLIGSQERVVYTGKSAASRGHEVVIPKLKISPTAAAALEYCDSGDLYIDGLRVEVKSFDHYFTDASNWKYRPNFIVDAVNTFDRKTPRPHRYIYWNNDKTHYARIFVRPTREYWTVHRIFNRQIKEYNDYYYCPMELVQWKKDPGVRVPLLEETNI